MNPRGFTLIELLVSVAIFTVVMTISLGALLSIAAAERKAEAVKTVMNNINFAVESMTRTVRTGHTYSCNGGGDCTSGSGGHRLSFTSADGRSFTYCLGTIIDASCTTSTACPEGSMCSIFRSIDGSAFAPLTAPDVPITNLSFYVRGSSYGDGVQPQVIITLNSTVTVGAAPTQFDLQTSVTQRLHDQ